MFCLHKNIILIYVNNSQLVELDVSERTNMNIWHHPATETLNLQPEAKQKMLWCGEPAISLHSHHVSLVQWTTRLLPVKRDLGSKPLGGLRWNRDSAVSVVSLHWWPRREWSFLWPLLRRALSRTITRPSCRQYDNPIWFHTALLSRFHARCRSPFRLHNRRSRLLGGSPVESLQSHFILTMSHGFSGLPICFPSQGTRVQNQNQSPL